MSKKRAAVACALLLLGFSTPLTGFSVTAARAQSNAPAAPADTYAEVEKLVLEYYPKAKVTKGKDTVHFEYKVKNEIGYYSQRPVVAPIEGGILGDVKLKSGEYTDKDKDRLPSEEHDGFHTTYKMAPYSKKQNAHLLATLVYPQEVPTEFKEKFRELIKSFNAGEVQEVAAAAPPPAAPPAAPSATAATTAAPASPSPPAATAPAATSTETPAAASSSSGWPLLQPPGMLFSVRVPHIGTPKTTKTSETITNTQWETVGDLNRYIVTVFKYAPDAYDPASFTKFTMDGAAAEAKTKPAEVTINGMKGVQITKAKTATTNAERMVCISTVGYSCLFTEGSPVLPTLDDPFFSSIKVEILPFVPFKDITRSDFDVSFKMPTAHKSQSKSDKEGTGQMWFGMGDGDTFVVACLLSSKPAASDAQKNLKLDEMSKNLNGPGKTAVLEKTLNVDGVITREYAYTDKDMGQGKVLMAVSNKNQYMFSASGPNFKSSKLVPEFFQAIKFGKH